MNARTGGDERTHEQGGDERTPEHSLLKDGAHLKIISFQFPFEKGVDLPPPIWTLSLNKLFVFLRYPLLVCLY